MNLTKLSPGFGRSPAVGQVPTPSALSPRSVHPTGHRDGGGTIQLRSAGHAGALAARGRRGEDLQQDRRGPGLVEGGNQRKSECIQITSHPVSAAHGPPCSQPAQLEHNLLPAQQGAERCVPLPHALFWLMGGLSSHQSHRCVLSRCCVTGTRDVVAGQLGRFWDLPFLKPALGGFLEEQLCR